MIEATKTIYPGLATDRVPLISDGISNMVASGAPNIERCSIVRDGVKREVVIKHKDVRILLRGISMLTSNNTSLKISLLRHHKVFGYNQSCQRESYIYQNLDPALRVYLPQYFGAYRRGLQYSLILDFIEPRHDRVQKDDYKRVFSTLTDIQAHYYAKPSCIRELQLNHYTPQNYKTSKPTLQRILKTLSKTKDAFTSIETNDLVHFIEICDAFCNKYQSHCTLTHNDFSYRNIFLTDDHTYFYDWELATFQNPEHDLIEFLAYHADFYTDAEITGIIRYYYHELKNKVNLKFNDSELQQILQYNLFEFAINRLSLLRLASQSINIPMTSQIVENTDRLFYLIGRPKL